MEKFPAQSITDLQAEQTDSELNQAESISESDRDHQQKIGQKILKNSEGIEWRRQSSFVQAETEPDYEEDFTPEQLRQQVERRFNVNPDRFPILRDQAIKTSNKVLDINETLSILVQDTADTIAVLAGEAQGHQRPSDAAIYLDKSARPVSWLVNEMWEDFTDAPRPEYEGFLAIDRITWFRAVGLNVDSQGNIIGEHRKAKYIDFLRASEKQPISRSNLARARLALIPDGIKKLRDTMTDAELADFDRYNPLAFDPEERKLNGPVAPELPDWIVEKIFSVPTGLEGKKITVIDEVSNSGATVKIARDIVRDAINSPDTEVETHTFWLSGTQKNKNDEEQMQSTPVWYDHDANPELGKGIGDVNYRLMRENFLKKPDLANLEALYIAPFRGRSLDMSGKEGESSVELQKEFQRLAKLYREDRILMATPRRYDMDKWADHYEELGVKFAYDSEDKDSYFNIKKSFNKNSPQR